MRLILGRVQCFLGHRRKPFRLDHVCFVTLLISSCVYIYVYSTVRMSQTATFGNVVDAGMLAVVEL